jgi:prepilin-type N-terminal cleavage/methylation domain-containing protein
MIWQIRTQQIAGMAHEIEPRSPQVGHADFADSRSASERGFTLIEGIVVATIILILTAVAVAALGPMRDSAKLNSAVQTTINQLRMAHEEALAKRLQYVVTLQQPGTILTQWTKAGVGLQTERSVPLPNGIQFIAVPGIPTIPFTPDGFGAGNVAIDFDQATGGGQNVIYFQPDGTAIDAAGNPNNGVVYIAKPGELSTSRAITLFGSTGRLKTWYLRQQGAIVKWQ